MRAGPAAIAASPPHPRAAAGDAGLAPCCRLTAAAAESGRVAAVRGRHVLAAGRPAAVRLAAGAGPAGRQPGRVQRALGRRRPGEARERVGSVGGRESGAAGRIGLLSVG